MATEIGFIVEGHCEYESIPSIVGKIHGTFRWPIVNAKGIGNIIKNIDQELLYLIKYYEPRKVIISLDYREAEREGLVNNCIELKERIIQACNRFIESQKNGSLTLPNEIVVIIAYQTYESWICADYIGLRENNLFNADLITETYTNVDDEIPNPYAWLNSKLLNPIDMKSRSYRKLISRTLRPHVAAENSRSFRKFYNEVNNI